jgi:hypothetical protein
MAAEETNADLAVQLETLARELRELDERNLELEQLAAQRGVKLSCANIALSRAKIAFEQAAHRREEMVQDVAHDLRTPLTSIKGATQNLLDDMAGPLSDSARAYVEIVGDQAERLIGIVNWLVDAIRVSLDPVELETTPVEIDQLARRVVRGLRPIADEQEIEFTVETEPAGALVDPDEVEHVFDRYYRSSHPRGGSGLGRDRSLDAMAVRLLREHPDRGRGARLALDHLVVGGHRDLDRVSAEPSIQLRLQLWRAPPDRDVPAPAGHGAREVLLRCGRGLVDRNRRRILHRRNDGGLRVGRRDGGNGDTPCNHPYLHPLDSLRPALRQQAVAASVASSLHPNSGPARTAIRHQRVAVRV